MRVGEGSYGCLTEIDEYPSLILLTWGTVFLVFWKTALGSHLFIGKIAMF
jgi:hypothetical protein